MLDGLIAVAEPLARRPVREIILARLVSGSAELTAAAAELHAYSDALSSRGIAARSAVFTSRSTADDILRLATEQAVDLIVLDAPGALLDDTVVQGVLGGSPCDVALVTGSSAATLEGPVLIPFVGADHDWSAVELVRGSQALWESRSGLPARPRPTETPAGCSPVPRLLYSVPSASGRNRSYSSRGRKPSFRLPTRSRSSSSVCPSAGGKMASAQSARPSPRMRGRRSCSSDGGSVQEAWPQQAA